MMASCATCAFNNVNYVDGAKQPPCWHPSYVQRAVPDFAGGERIIFTLAQLTTCPVYAEAEGD